MQSSGCGGLRRGAQVQLVRPPVCARATSARARAQPATSEPGTPRPHPNASIAPATCRRAGRTSVARWLDGRDSRRPRRPRHPLPPPARSWARRHRGELDGCGRAVRLADAESARDARRRGRQRDLLRDLPSARDRPYPGRRYACRRQTSFPGGSRSSSRCAPSSRLRRALSRSRFEPHASPFSSPSGTSSPQKWTRRPWPRR
jgi:hypothetical protein